MKTKSAQNAPTQDLKHLRLLHKLVEKIASYGEHPANWPLTRAEQVEFVRQAVFNAREIKKSESYVNACVVIAAEDLAMSS